MRDINFLFFKNGRSLTELQNTGYFTTDYVDDMCNSLHFRYPEEKIIEKINANEDGYFDFSKTIVDVGSEIGVYSWATNFSFSHMFDGNHDKLVISEMNMLIRGRGEKYVAHNVLLSEKREVVSYNGFFSEYTDDFNDTLIGGVPTQAKTLDEFGIDNVGLIKIDVEGMELKVLKGSVGTIMRNNFPPILFELWPVDNEFMSEEKFNKTRSFIEDLGYEILWNYGDEQTHLAVYKNKKKKK